MDTVFKTGDRVRTVTTGGIAAKGTEGEVIVPADAMGVVQFRPDNGTKVWPVFASDLELIPASLPVGKASLLHNDVFTDWDATPTGTITRICDCGGFKVHKSLEPIYHSHWCSTQKDN